MQPRALSMHTAHPQGLFSRTSTRFLTGLLLLALGVAHAPTWGEAADAPVAPGHVNLAELDNLIIGPATQQYLLDAIARSETDGATCLIILLDTPGGLLESTRAIVKRILNARVPIVVYVAPPGSRAGSAGLFITLAAHVAAMAPSTNIGAAHPVDLGGGSPAKRLLRRIRPEEEVDEPRRSSRRKKEQPPKSDELIEEEYDPMSDKILNDTVAWVTTIAQTRGRDTDAAVRAVKESASITETEALKIHLIDLVATDLPELLTKLEGRSVILGGAPVELHTAQAQVVRIPISRRQEFLATITNPNVAYILMLLGMLGLIFEFTHPGIGFPGIAGLMCLLLALYAFQALPVSYAAIGLMLLGVALLIAEIKVVSYGLLGVGGVISLSLGSLLLFESPDPSLQVSLRIIIPAVSTLAAILLFVAHRAFTAQRQPVTSGVQGLVGTTGIAATALSPDGKVQVHGELWNATSSRPASKGERVQIKRVDGMHVYVEPL